MKRVVLISIIAFILLVSGCSNDNKSLLKDNEQLKIRISQLENDLKDSKQLKSQITQQEKELSDKNIIIEELKNKESL